MRIGCQLVIDESAVVWLLLVFVYYQNALGYKLREISVAPKKVAPEDPVRWPKKFVKSLFPNFSPRIAICLL